jgi:hypothetical protein
LIAAGQTISSWHDPVRCHGDWDPDRRVLCLAADTQVYNCSATFACTPGAWATQETCTAMPTELPIVPNEQQGPDFRIVWIVLDVVLALAVLFSLSVARMWIKLQLDIRRYGRPGDHPAAPLLVV